MTTSEIVQIISISLAGISAICSAVVCCLTFKTTRPYLKISIDKKGKLQCVYYLDKGFNTALASVRIRNNSNVAGEISEACLKFKGVKYYSRSVRSVTPFSCSNIEITDSVGNSYDPSKFICFTPKIIKPYSEEQVVFVFQKLPKEINNLFIARLSFRVCGRLFNFNFIRTTFVSANPMPNKLDNAPYSKNNAN